MTEKIDDEKKEQELSFLTFSNPVKKSVYEKKLKISVGMYALVKTIPESSERIEK